VTDRDALFAAILAHPDEDTPRLAFADWLEEHGDAPYAAFIRKQIELAKVPEWDPLWVRTKYLDPSTISGDEWPRPEVQHPISWGGPLRRSAFRRGFPSAITAYRAAPLRDKLADLVKLAPVEEVTWYGAGPSERGLPEWAALVADPVFARVRSLTPALGSLSVDDIRELHDSPHAAGLRELNMSTCDLDRARACTLLSLPRFRQLRSLELRLLNEGADDVEKAAAAFTGHELQSLHLSWGSTLERSWLLWEGDFLSSPLLRGLKSLDLSESPMRTGDAEALARSPALTGLECLQLNRCNGGGDELAIALAGCAGLTSLRQLDLRENGIGPKGARALAESPHLANLRILDLCDNPIGDDGAIALFKSAHLTRLLDLNLLFGGVGDGGANVLLDSPLPDSLLHLELHMTTMYMVKGHSPITEPVARRLRERFGERLVLDAVTPPLA
jgi:uncharacterized protein (TIGR02996 family)